MCRLCTRDYGRRVYIPGKMCTRFVYGREAEEMSKACITRTIYAGFVFPDDCGKVYNQEEDEREDKGL